MYPQQNKSPLLGGLLGQPNPMSRYPQGPAPAPPPSPIQAPDMSDYARLQQDEERSAPLEHMGMYADGSRGFGVMGFSEGPGVQRHRDLDAWSPGQGAAQPQNAQPSGTATRGEQVARMREPDFFGRDYLHDMFKAQQSTPGLARELQAKRRMADRYRRDSGPFFPGPQSLD